ncbi:8305_t:CDS:1 [Ambispora gerdemannii]|uniref:8305_t:CDS:1 n=1 Tax=Ambispora gerdemannii TaxID=144530 RepID=A0A9N9CTZ7_9GLOM|nr:8305_t:CDS:1 [Ambispora gerdemannii]
MPKRKFSKFQELDASIQIIHPPKKPRITIEDLIQNAQKKLNHTKIPNAFMIYRGEILKELNSQSFTVKMPRLSAIASKTWKIEAKEIKDEYYRLSKEANIEYKKLNCSIQQASHSNEYSYDELTLIDNEQVQQFHGDLINNGQYRQTSFFNVNVNEQFYAVPVNNDNRQYQQALFPSTSASASEHFNASK